MKRLFAVTVVTAAFCLSLASAASAEVRPGVQTITEGSGQCTANFVFSDGANTYLGQSAHCASTGAATSTNGCVADSLPLGTKVEVEDASNPGTFPVVGELAYSSWHAMKANNEPEAGENCGYNDFALVKLPAGHRGQPDRPVLGRPERPRRRDRRRRGRLHLRQLVAAPRHRGPQAQARQEPRHHRRRLVAHRLHAHAGHPR